MIIIRKKISPSFFFSIFFITIEISAMFPMGTKNQVTSEQRAKALNAIRVLQENKVEPFLSNIPKCSDNELLIYPNNEPLSQGTCWSKETLLLSKTLKDFIEDMGGWENFKEKRRSIPHSSTTIKNAHRILTEYDSTKNKDEQISKIEATISAYSFQQLNDTAKCIEYLDCPSDIKTTLLESMKQKLLKSSTYLNEVDFNLYPDLKSYALSPLINWVKNLFVAQNMQNKNNKKIISQESAYDFDPAYTKGYHLHLFQNINCNPKDHITFNQGSNIIVSDLDGNKQSTIKIPVNIYFPMTDNAHEIITSPDGKYATYTNSNNAICIQEISSQKVTPLTPNKRNYRTSCLAFTNDSTKLATVYKKQVTIWNINGPENPISHFTIPDDLISHSIAFNSDSTKIAISGLSYSNMNDTRIYAIYIFNTSDGNLIQKLKTQFEGFAEKIIFTPDDRRIIAIGEGYETTITENSLSQRYDYKKNLIIWNIENIKNVSYKILDYIPTTQNAIALSANGTTMFTGGSQQNKNALELWDLSNYDNITHSTVAKLDGICNSLAFSKDNTMLVSGDGSVSGIGGYTTSLIRWDILSSDDNTAAENIKNYKPEAIKLLYQLYLKENVTNPTIFDDLPENIQTVLPKPYNYKTSIKQTLDTTSSSPSQSSWGSWLKNLFSQFQYYVRK